MAEIIQGILEDMVTDLAEMRDRDVFSDEEIKEIIEKRRAFEYKLMRSKPSKRHYLGSINYEIELEEIRQSRKEQMNLKPASSDRSIVRRILSLFKRFTNAFKHDLEAWKEFINFCVRSKSDRDLSQVLAEAIKLHSGKEEIWILARIIEEKVKNDIDSARSILQRAVAVLSKSEKLWTEYFTFEVTHSGETEVPLIVFKYAIEKLPHIGGSLVKTGKELKLSKKILKEMRVILKSSSSSD